MPKPAAREREAAAAGRARARRRAPAAARRCNWSIKKFQKFVWKYFKLCSLLLLIWLLYVDPSGITTNMSRIFAAWAVFSEGTVAAATTAVAKTSNVTVDVVLMAAKALDSGRSVASEAFIGIDVMNISGDRKIVRFAATSADAAALFVLKGAAGTVPAAVAPHLADAISNVSRSLPTLYMKDLHFDLGARTFISWEMKSRFLHTGHVAVAFSVVNADFGVQWANFLWELLELDLERHSGHILEGMLKHVDRLEPKNAAAWSVDDAAFPVDALPSLTSERVHSGVMRLMSLLPGASRTASVVWALLTGLCGVMIIALYHWNVLGTFPNDFDPDFDGVDTVFVQSCEPPNYFSPPMEETSSSFCEYSMVEPVSPPSPTRVRALRTHSPRSLG